MAGITDALTRKLGPAPVWAWLAVGGVGLFLVSRSGLLRGITGQSAAPIQQQPAAAPAESPNAGAQLQSEIGLLQQLQAFQQQSYQNNLQQVQQTQQTTQALNPPASGPAGLQAGKSGFVNTGQGQYRWVVFPGNASPGDIATQFWGSPNQGELFSVGTSFPDPAGTGAVVWVVPTGNYPRYSGAIPPAATQAGGQGGGANRSRSSRSGPRIPAQLHAIGGGAARHAGSVGVAHPIWRPGNPLLRAGAAGPMYPHYAMAGPRHVLQIGGATGVHPARILALNAGIKRGYAAPGQRVRVA